MGTILLIEPDTTTRDDLFRRLKEAGCDVMITSSVLEDVLAYTLSTEVRAVFCAYDLAEAADGLILAVNLRKYRSKVRILLYGKEPLDKATRRSLAKAKILNLEQSDLKAFTRLIESLYKPLIP